MSARSGPVTASGAPRWCAEGGLRDAYAEGGAPAALRALAAERGLPETWLPSRLAGDLRPLMSNPSRLLTWAVATRLAEWFDVAPAGLRPLAGCVRAGRRLRPCEWRRYARRLRADISAIERLEARRLLAAVDPRPEGRWKTVGA